MSRRDVFQAIADPNRRAIIELLSKGPMPVNAVAERFDMTRQAVSLHLKVLCECGLVHMHRRGRERYCEARLQQLAEASKWLQHYHRAWEQSLDKMERYLRDVQTSTTTKE